MLVFTSLLLLGSAGAFVRPVPRRPQLSLSAQRHEDSSDVVVVGSGLGGLCAAATLANYGYAVTVLEAHSSPGGAAHGFKAKAKGVDGDFVFDTGPSFFSGLSGASGGGGVNPLRDLLDSLGLSVPCHTYDSFGLVLPEGTFTHTTAFRETVLAPVGGFKEVEAWDALESMMRPLAAAVKALPAVALRTDLGIALTASRFLPGFGKIAALPEAPLPWTLGSTMTSDFGSLLDRAGLKRGMFGRNWLDLLCFCLSGLPADGTITAEMAMMMGEFYRPEAVMDYPMGGVSAIVDTLVEFIESKPGCQVRCNSKVSSFVRDGNSGRVEGALLASGSTEKGKVVIRASRGVISNVGTWRTQELLQGGGESSRTVEARWSAKQEATPPCASFMHLHLGLSTAGMSPKDIAALQCHYMVTGYHCLGFSCLVAVLSSHILIPFTVICCEHIGPGRMESRR